MIYLEFHTDPLIMKIKAYLREAKSTHVAKSHNYTSRYSMSIYRIFRMEMRESLSHLHAVFAKRSLLFCFIAHFTFEDCNERKWRKKKKEDKMNMYIQRYP